MYGFLCVCEAVATAMCGVPCAAAAARAPAAAAVIALIARVLRIYLVELVCCVEVPSHNKERNPFARTEGTGKSGT